MTPERDLEISQVHKSFGRLHVLRGIDLRVPAGSLTALLGPSGSGKTTLLRIIAGFERPDAGDVRVGDTVFDGATAHVRPERRRMGLVSQDGSLFPHLDVARNVAFGLPRSERRAARVGELLELVGLSDLTHRYPHELSGGQQQRVAVARTLAVRPEFVLLDEPFAALDYDARLSVRGDVRKILHDAGTTAILVTHDQDEALSTADYVAVIRDGVVAQVGTPDELYCHPVDAQLATLVGGANLLAGTIAQDMVQTLLGPAPFRQRDVGALEGPLDVLIRPEQLLVGRDESTPGVRGRVRDTQFHGHDVTVTVRISDDTGTCDVVARILGPTPLPVDAEVRVSIRGTVDVWTRHTAR